MARRKRKASGAKQPWSRLFRRGETPDLVTTNACLNFTSDPSALYMRGYQEAADILLAHVEETGGKQDTLVFPIIFNYRHYLELLLKESLRLARLIFGTPSPTDDELADTHNLGVLWQWLKPQIPKLGDPDEVRDDLKQAHRVFGEFQKFDTNAASFRYATDRNGQPHLPDFRLINIRSFRDECAATALFLEGISAALMNALDCVNDRRADYD